VFGSEVALTVIGGVAADSVAYWGANAFGIGNGNASASMTPVKVDIAKARLTAGSQPGVTAGAGPASGRNSRCSRGRPVEYTDAHGPPAVPGELTLPHAWSPSLGARRDIAESPMIVHDRAREASPSR
jgi:hypothetical protein